MKDFKFDKIKNFNISDEWADRVIDTVSGMKPPLNYKRIVASCACMFTVCAISVFMYSFFGQNSATISVADNSTVSDTKEPLASQSVTSQPAFEDYSNDVTQAPAQQETKNEDKVQQETKPFLPVTPSKPFTDTPTQPPTQPHTQPPTLPPVNPTSPPETTEPPAQPQQPTKDTDTESSGDCIVSFSPSYLVGSGNIYCRVRDKDMQTVGDRNLFSDQHLASFYSGFGSTYQYIYSPSSAGLKLEPGTYYYYFYNEHGVPILNTTVIIE